MEFQRGAVKPVGSIEKGWNLIKDDYWTFFLMTLVMGVILLVAALIFGTINNLIVFGVSAILGSAAGGGTPDAVRVSAAIVPQLLSMVVSLFTNILLGAISGVLFCGIYVSLTRRESGEAFNFGDLFSQFQKFTSCLIVAAALAFFQFVLSIVLLFIGLAVGVSTFGMGMINAEGKMDPKILGGLFLGAAVFGLIYIAVNIVISALTTFAYPLVAEHNLSGGEALMLSIKSGLGNFGGLILLLILIMLMSFAGLLACVIGIIFVIPIIVATIFAAYRSVFAKSADSYIHMPPSPPSFGNQAGY